MSIDESTIRAIADDIEIRNLLGRELGTIDGWGTMEDMLACWTDDCIWESSAFGTWRGHEGLKARFVDHFEKADEYGVGLDYKGTCHCFANVQIKVDGDKLKFEMVKLEMEGGKAHWKVRDKFELKADKPLADSPVQPAASAVSNH